MPAFSKSRTIKKLTAANVKVSLGGVVSLKSKKTPAPTRYLQIFSSFPNKLMTTFSKGQSKDYIKKRNVKRNNLPKIERKGKVLSEGDGTLPKSRKWRTPKKKKEVTV